MFSFSGVSQDLNEVIMTMVNNTAVILAKARQQPSSGIPPTTPQPPASNPGAITPNPLSAAAGGALNVAPPWARFQYNAFQYLRPDLEQMRVACQQ